MIQANLQAEILVLEGAKPYRNSWKNHLYMDKIYNRVSEMTQAASDLAKVFQNREVAISASMTLNDANYELRSFEMEFMQEVDSTFGEPKTSSRGGFALVSLFQLPDENINSWLVSPDRAKGEFRFGHEQFGYPLKIGFADAQCAGCFAECVNGSDTNVLTRMNIAPMTLSLNGVPYRNFSVSEPEKQIKW